MTKETAVVLNSATSVDRFDDQEMIRTLKETVCKGATDAQFRMFVEICRATNLNPFLKEIWFVPNVGVMAGRDGYLRVANEHPQFDGMETLVERDPQGIPVKATCKVWRKDRSHPITCEAYYNEYRKGSSVWTTYKSAMIGKVAEVLALKRSFSINGVVTEEEIGEQRAANGSHEAQQEVAQRIIQENEQRRGAVEVLTEAPAELPKAALQPKMLKSFQEMKGLLGEYDYYRILKQYGYSKSNQIPDAEAGKAVYKTMKGYLNASEPWTRLEHRGKERFHNLLRAEGCDSIHEAVGREDAAEILLRLEMALSIPESPKDKLKKLEQKDSKAFWRIAGGTFGLDEESISTMSVQAAEKLHAQIQAEMELGL